MWLKAKQYLTISRSSRKCRSKLFSCTAETRARSDESFYKTYGHFNFCSNSAIHNLRKQNIECIIFYNNVYFSKPGFCVRPVNRFFSSKFISWYFLLMFPLCVALLRKTIPCSNSCSNVYPLEQRLLAICENHLYYVVYCWSSVGLFLDKNSPFAILYFDKELAPSI